MVQSTRFLLIPKFSAVVSPPQCPAAKMTSRRPSGCGEDGFRAPGDAAMANIMDLPEQRSEIALPQAIPGAPAAPEAAVAAESSFEPDVHGQGDERRGAAARSRDLEGPAPKMQWLASPPEADTHPHFEDNRVVTDRASSKIGQPSRACTRARPPELPILDGAAQTDSWVTDRQGLGARAGSKSLAWAPQSQRHGAFAQESRARLFLRCRYPRWYRCARRSSGQLGAAGAGSRLLLGPGT